MDCALLQDCKGRKAEKGRQRKVGGRGEYTANWSIFKNGIQDKTTRVAGREPGDYGSKRHARSQMTPECRESLTDWSSWNTVPTKSLAICARRRRLIERSLLELEVCSTLLHGKDFRLGHEVRETFARTDWSGRLVRHVVSRKWLFDILLLLQGARGRQQRSVVRAWRSFKDQTTRWSNTFAWDMAAVLVKLWKRRCRKKKRKHLAERF